MDMVDDALNAKNVEVLLFVNMGDTILNARNAEALVSANIEDDAINAKNVEVPLLFAVILMKNKIVKTVHNEIGCDGLHYFGVFITCIIFKINVILNLSCNKVYFNVIVVRYAARVSDTGVNIAAV